MAYLESRQRATTSLLVLRRAGGSSSGTGSGTLIAIICFLALGLLATAVGFVLVKRCFRPKQPKEQQPRTFVGDQVA